MLEALGSIPTLLKKRGRMIQKKNPIFKDPSQSMGVREIFPNVIIQ
jgi:hypothetical protein